ncbi:MAG: RHS repeat-associated core domain-containing protein [Phycisphaerae bacterium]
MYDVVVAKPGLTSHQLVDAFELTAGGAAVLDTRLIVPEWIGRTWRQTIWIEYANIGESSMLAPLLKVDGADQAMLTLDPTLPAMSTDVFPAGVSDSVQVMATGSGATPGILQPGDSGRIPIYFIGLKGPWNWSDWEVEFGLSVLTADSMEPIDWPAVSEEIRPESLSADAWDAICANLQVQVGDTWGDYVAMLNENMNYLYDVGQNVSDVASLLAFEIEQASGLSPYTYLAGEVDAYCPAPGIALTFGRAYGESIDSRYELGPLGYGWSHNWDVHVQELSDGNVVVHGPYGAQRYFSLRSDGGYTASPGDYGDLTFSGGKYRLTEKHGTVWQFRSDGLLQYVEDTNGNRITCGYSSGLLTSLTHTSGAQLLLDYDANGRLWHLTDPRGALPDHVTTFEYDPSGEYLLTVTAPGDRVTTYTYETAGTPQKQHTLLSVEYPDGTHDHFTYDEQGRLIEAHGDAGAESVTYAYDSAGTVTVEDAAGRLTALSFGLGGQLAQARDGEGNTVSLAYDRDYELTSLTGASGQEYGYTYDSSGNLVGIEDPLRRDTAFTYSVNLSNLTSVTDARGNGMVYGYDAAGNLLSITYEDGTSESFTYDAAGNVLTWTNRRGDTVTYTYSASGQLTSKDYPDTPGLVDFEYLYDDAGNLTSAIGPEGTTSFMYDPDTDWLTRIDYPGGQWFEFEYDAAGRRTKRTDQDGNVVNYLYDAVGRLDRMTDGTDALIVDYDYDAAGWLSRKTLGNAVYTTYEYDAAGQLLHLVNHKPDDTLLSRFDYTYDASSRRTSMTVEHSPALPTDGLYEYGYDPLGQLTSVTYPDGHVVEYVYDAVGNRMEVTDDGTATPYTTNEMNQYKTVGAATYTFDDDGNVVTKTEGGVTTTYTYNVENRLARVETPTDVWEYTYDAFGNRIASSHNGVATDYVVDLIGFGDVAAEYDAAGDLVARYDHGLGLLSRTDSAGDAAWYSFEAIGSTSELTDGTGDVLNTYTWDPFGISLGGAETVFNPFQYVGEYGVMHETNGLEFMRARFYDAAIGRFACADPISINSNDVNLYRYTCNHPVGRTDPLGLATGVGGLGGSLPWDLSDFGGGGDPDGGKGLMKKYEELMREKMEKKMEDLWSGPPSDDLDDPRARQQSHPESGDKNPNDEDDPDDKKPGTGVKFPDGVMKGPAFGEPEKTPDESMPTEETDQDEAGIVRPRDPNDKVAPAGYGTANFILPDDTLSYQIRFENVSDATAPAHFITITDALDEDLDLSTFELNEIAFAGHTIIVPKGLDYYETTLDLNIDNEYVTNSHLRVEINVSLDKAGRELTCTLVGLDPETGWLPEDILLGILYPNDDTSRGDGHISYTVKPKAGLPSGTEISNMASIVFDWNDPIDTPKVLNTLDAIAPTSVVSALPAISPAPSFLVTWSGSDDANGAGIATYDIYVSDNDGSWTLWLDDTDQTEATFNGLAGHTYRFYSRAMDGVGHQEDAPATADAVTFVPAMIVSRHIFYNNSYFDGNNAGANASDDAAIDTSKFALIPGGIGAFANYTSYSRGLNGIMIDIDGLASTPSDSDFVFKVGNSEDPSTWAMAPAPTSITVRPGEGASGSDRVTILWADNAIQKQWLQVTLLSDANGGSLGLAEDDVFYFGNSIGETGNSGSNTFVDGTDFVGVRDNPHNFLDRAPVTDAYDINRDSFVDGTDLVLVRDNNTNFLNCLKLIGVPAATGGAESMLVLSLASEPTVTPLATADASAGSSGSETAAVDGVLGNEFLWLSDQNSVETETQPATDWEVTLPQAEGTAMSAAPMAESTTQADGLSVDQAPSETVPWSSRTGVQPSQGEPGELGLDNGLEDVLALPELMVPLGA